VQAMFKEHVKDLPEDAFIFSKPHADDGLGAKRSSIYEKAGFRDLPGVRGGLLWALKNQGTFTKIPDAQVEYVADLIKGGGAAKKRKDAVELATSNSAMPSSDRQDLKCGKSGIAKGKKCKKGRGIETALNVAGGALFAGGLVGMGVGAFKDKNSSYAGGMSTMYAGAALLNESIRRKGKRTGNKKLEKQGASGRNVGIAGAAGFGAAAVAFKRGEVKSEKEFNERMKNNAKYYQEHRGTYGGGGSYSGSSESYKKAYEEARKAQQERKAAKANYNPFKDLGVDANATDDDIQKAYRKAARANHPDLGGDPEKMKQINTAYEAIKRKRGRKDSADDGWELIVYDYSPRGR